MNSIVFINERFWERLTLFFFRKILLLKIVYCTFQRYKVVFNDIKNGFWINFKIMVCNHVAYSHDSFPINGGISGQ